MVLEAGQRVVRSDPAPLRWDTLPPGWLDRVHRVARSIAGEDLGQSLFDSHWRAVRPDRHVHGRQSVQQVTRWFRERREFVRQPALGRLGPSARVVQAEATSAVAVVEL